MGAELALRPTCPKGYAGHGPMQLREKPDKLAAELGTWYDCHALHGGRRCTSSALIPAPWLAEQYAAARAAAADLDEPEPGALFALPAVAVAG